jgi:hypothetical protein
MIRKLFSSLIVLLLVCSLEANAYAARGGETQVLSDNYGQQK